MTHQTFLVDANIFLTPVKRSYYNFNIAPSYWEQFNLFAKQGHIKTIDHVNYKKYIAWTHIYIN